ncbi:MAG: four helix bundle protein [Candidatus Doudnabacteria bacterium]|nr:four helix bundle protein [Candidatus Doudnabacteria bacterium]
MQNEKLKFKEDFVKRLVKFTVDIVRISRKLRGDSSLWSIIDQLIRAAGSIGANVVEAKSSSSKRDYLHFFEIALKSANETKYWLIVLKETVTGFDTDIDRLCQEADEISKVLAASVLTLKGKKDAF